MSEELLFIRPTLPSSINKQPFRTHLFMRTSLLNRYRQKATLTSGMMYNWRVKGIQNALLQRGKAEGPLEPEDLTALGHLDQYHYLGTEACDHVIQLLGLSAKSTVLDIGSGIGGPARYIATKSGCKVTGIELQPELAQAAVELSARVRGLEDKVHFVNGDFTTMDLEQLPCATYDHFISQLVFLHIPDRAALLERCYSTLTPGGTFVIEDFAQRLSFTSAESSTLIDVVSAPSERRRVEPDAMLTPCSLHMLTPCSFPTVTWACTRRRQPSPLPSSTWRTCSAAVSSTCMSRTSARPG